LEFCPECQQKIWWTCGFEPTTRYRKLLEFAEKYGLKEEADYWQMAIDRFTK